MEFQDELARTPQYMLPCAKNLIHYLCLRRVDHRQLQWDVKARHHHAPAALLAPPTSLSAECGECLPRSCALAGPLLAF